MLSLKKHIAILLFGIFTFPLVYQPYHVIVHHSHKVSCHHTCCHTPSVKQNCCYGPSISSALEKDKPCPICEYHFPINILPKHFVYTGKTVVVENTLADIEIRLPFAQVISQKTPRAPPTAS